MTLTRPNVACSPAAQPGLTDPRQSVMLVPWLKRREFIGALDGVAGSVHIKRISLAMSLLVANIARKATPGLCGTNALDAAVDGNRKHRSQAERWW